MKDTVVRERMAFSVPAQYTEMLRKMFLGIGAIEIKEDDLEDEPFLPEGLLPQYESKESMLKEAERRYNEGNFIPNLTP